MPTPLVIVGCGGFGREVWSIAQAINAVSPTFDLMGFVDDDPAPAHREALERLDAALLGGLSWLDHSDPKFHAVIGIGSGPVRRSLDQRWPDRTWATLIHPDATVGHDVRLSPGVVLAPGARVSTAVRIGRHVHLDQNATVGHDCVLKDYSRLNPQACVSGNVRIGPEAAVGASATVLQGLDVGDSAIVGAGAVVTRHVPPTATVKGVPAR